SCTSPIAVVARRSNRSRSALSTPRGAIRNTPRTSSARSPWRKSSSSRSSRSSGSDPTSSPSGCGDRSCPPRTADRRAVARRRPIEVVAWADEEGARFGVGLFGSAAVFGRLAPGVAERRDRQGISVADALRALGERGDPALARRGAKDFTAYLELHIEQGPRLEQAGLALGVVAAIVGIYHARVTMSGQADHAGATVMTSRADALVAASEVVLAVERIARARPNTVGTVGEIAVRPGAKNVVPGECVFSLDLRTSRDLDPYVHEVLASVERIAHARNVGASID